MCTEAKAGEVKFTLSRVIVLGLPENFTLRRAPTRHVLARSVETSAPSEGFIHAACERLGLAGPAPTSHVELPEEVLLEKASGVFVKCEYLGNVPEGRRYGEKFTFSVTVVGKQP